MKGFLRALRGWLGLIALACFLAPRFVPALVDSWARWTEAAQHIGETEDETLACFRNPEYPAALQRVKDAIPPDGEYWLVRAPDDPHNIIFIRYDLAPRKARWPTPGLPLPSDGPEWVVLSRLEPPGPEVLPTETYLAGSSE